MDALAGEIASRFPGISIDARLLGEQVAHLHVALAEAFGAEPADGDAWASDMSAQLSRVATDRLATDRIEAIYGRLRGAEDLGAAIENGSQDD